jgi:hypothetical protein
VWKEGNLRSLEHYKTNMHFFVCEESIFKGIEILFSEIIAENFPNFGTSQNVDIHVHKAYRTTKKHK